MLLKNIIPGIFLLVAVILQAQDRSFIGMHMDDVEQQMKKEYADFSQDNSIVKKQFNYLKYVNMSQSITWIIYFSGEDNCTSTKKVCDYIEYDRVVGELDDSYSNTGENQWEYSSDGITYTLELKEEDWYFTVRESLKE